MRCFLCVPKEQPWRVRDDDKHRDSLFGVLRWLADLPAVAGIDCADLEGRRWVPAAAEKQEGGLPLIEAGKYECAEQD